MTEYAAMFEIKGLIATSIEVPDKGEIDQDFVFRKLSPEPESWIAVLRVRTKEKEDYFASEAYGEARERLRNFVCIHSVVHGYSASTKSLGVCEIEKDESLVTAKLRYLTLKASVYYPEEKKARVVKREHEAIKKSIEVFKTNENILRSSPYLMNAVHFFHYSNLTERIEEKLIDLVISLEALYLTERMELGYRLSLRVASLIGHLYNDRTVQQIAEEIRNLYDKRSSIVHGDPEKITNDEILRLESYVRRSIQMFLKLSATKSKSDVLKLVDASLFDDKIKEFLRK